MKTSLFTALSMLFLTTDASEVSLYSANCPACTGAGNVYCGDNNACINDYPNDFCPVSDVANRQQSCSQASLNVGISTACDEAVNGVDPITEYYRMIYLEPKTACGFYIRGD